MKELKNFELKHRYVTYTVFYQLVKWNTLHTITKSTYDNMYV